MTYFLTHPLQLVLAVILGGVAVMIASKIVPGFEIRGGFKTALIVAVVYGVLKLLLQGVLITVTLPFVVLTLGLFIFVINAFLLWLTDKILEDFEVKSIGSLLLGALCLSAVDLVFRILVRSGTIF